MAMPYTAPHPVPLDSSTAKTGNVVSSAPVQAISNVHSVSVLHMARRFHLVGNHRLVVVIVSSHNTDHTGRPMTIHGDIDCDIVLSKHALKHSAQPLGGQALSFVGEQRRHLSPRTVRAVVNQLEHYRLHRTDEQQVRQHNARRPLVRKPGHVLVRTPKTALLRVAIEKHHPPLPDIHVSAGYGSVHNIQTRHLRTPSGRAAANVKHRCKLLLKHSRVCKPFLHLALQKLHTVQVDGVVFRKVLQSSKDSTGSGVGTQVLHKLLHETECFRPVRGMLHESKPNSRARHVIRQCRHSLRKACWKTVPEQKVVLQCLLQLHVFGTHNP